MITNQNAWNLAAVTHTQYGVPLTPYSGGLDTTAQLKGQECPWPGILFPFDAIVPRSLF